MVVGVARAVSDPKALDVLPALKRDHVLGGDRGHLSPKALQIVPVKATGALEQLPGVDQVPGPDLVHVDPQVRKASHERTRRAGVVEVDVGEEERPRLALEPGEEILQAR